MYLHSYRWEPILRYIQEQYQAYNKEESAVVRKRHIRDSRIHLLLYFISPSSRGCGCAHAAGCVGKTMLT